MTKRQAEWLLAGVILARATSYLFSKAALRSMGTFNLLALRFLLTFVMLALLFFRRFRGLKPVTLLRGAGLGCAFFLVMACELTALKSTDTSTTSFLENTAVIFVPLLEAVLLQRRPRPAALLSGALALLGVGLLTLSDGSLRMETGELFALAAAVLYAGAILLTDRFAHEDDGLMLGILQVGFLGLLALAASFVFEAPRLPAAPAEWGLVAVLALVCTGFGFTLQPVAQSRLSAERAGLFCALNPAFAALLGVLFLREPLTLPGIVGAGLILSSLLIPNLQKERGRTEP